MVTNFRGDTKVSNKKRKVAAAVGMAAVGTLLAAGAYTKHQNAKAQKGSLNRLQDEMVLSKFIRNVNKNPRFAAAGGRVPERRPDLPSSPVFHDVRYGDFKGRPPRSTYGSKYEQQDTEKFLAKERGYTIKPPPPDLPKLKTASEFQALLRNPGKQDIHLTRPRTNDPWHDELADVMSR